ncbi:CAP domain-containing protein [bacterium]|nr:CAP domain-containing protein [bacterium]
MAFIKIVFIFCNFLSTTSYFNKNIALTNIQKYLSYSKNIDYVKKSIKLEHQNRNNFDDLVEFTKKNQYKLSNKLSNIAEELNNTLEKENQLSFSEKELRDIFYQNRFYFYRFFPKTFNKNSVNYIEDIKLFILMNKERYHSIGISESEKYFTVLVAYQPFELYFNEKKIYKQYQKISIKGDIIDFKLPYIDFYIKTPSSNVKKFLIPIVKNRFNFDFKFKEIGEYVIELIENQDNNPKIIAKFPINIEQKKTKSLKTDSISYSFCELKNIKTIEDVFEDINSIRKLKKLPHLVLSSELSEIAEKHSIDMAKNGFFSHISKNGKTPSQRVQEHGVFFKKILENISKANSICSAYDEILNSPGHLNNILDKDVTYIGIGVYQLDDYIYMTQNFIEKEDITSITLKKK